MESHGIVQNRQFRTFFLILSAAFAIFLILLLYPFQDGRVALFAKDVSNIIFSLAAFGVLYIAWSFSEVRDVSKRIWGLFALGILLWVAAEVIWAYYEIILGVETPYPSLADILWIPGYLLLFWGLILRYRMFNVKLDRRRIIALVLITALFLFATVYFVLMPNIVEFDAARLNESLLNLFYPLGDLVLFILSMLILFSFEKGRYAVTWMFVAIGFIVMSVSDLLFSYVSWYGYYYPDGRINFSSIMVDVTYALSYLLLALGIYAYIILYKIKQMVILSPVAIEQDLKTRILLITKADHSVIVYSENLLFLIGARERSQIENAPLHQVLHADPLVIDDLMSTLARREPLCNYPLTLGNGSTQTVFLTALALTNPRNQYTGAGIVLKADLSNGDRLVPPLTPEHAGLVESFLERAGAKVQEESQMLRYYFLEQIRLLFALVYEFAGGLVANRLLETITEKSLQNGWTIDIDQGQISIPDEYEGVFLAKVVSTLLADVRSAASRLISPSLVSNEMELVDQSLDQNVAETVRMYKAGMRN